MQPTCAEGRTADFGKPFSRARNKVLAVASLGALLVLVWQATTVYLNYGGSWNALFYTGDRFTLPPELASENVYVFPNNPGYDGMFYHLVAHDPFFRRGFSRFVDNASLRWRRILVPAMAHLAAFGNDAYIDTCFIAVNLLFVFLGVWWLSHFCLLQKTGALWGLLFLMVPSVLVSMDRMTIDTALAALTVGFVACASTGQTGISGAVLMLCPLARETGLCLTAGQFLANLTQRSWKRLVVTAATSVPFLFWTAFVSFNTYRDGTPWLSWPFAGILRRTLHPLQYPIVSPWIAVAAATDYLALLGIWIALILTAKLALKRMFGHVEACIFTFAFASLWLGKADIWAGAYEFGRTMSPLLILLAMIGVRDKNRWFLLPLACVLPRIFLQLEPQVRGILRHFI